MRSFFLSGLLAIATIATPAVAQAETPSASQLLSVTSRYDVPTTVARLKDDIAAKGIRFFADIDQAALAKEAGIDLPASHLLLFGNPQLGIQFLTANPDAGLDWPVRMLVTERAGRVIVTWTDFRAIGARYALRDRDAQLAMANAVAASIAASATR